jgi:hypothetical protein
MPAMFRRKKDDPAKGAESTENLAAPPLKPFFGKGPHAPLKPPSSAAFHPDAPRRQPPDIPSPPLRRPDRGLAGNGDEPPGNPPGNQPKSEKEAAA